MIAKVTFFLVLAASVSQLKAYHLCPNTMSVYVDTVGISFLLTNKHVPIIKSQCKSNAECLDFFKTSCCLNENGIRECVSKKGNFGN